MSALLVANAVLWSKVMLLIPPEKMNRRPSLPQLPLMSFHMLFLTLKPELLPGTEELPSRPPNNAPAPECRIVLLVTVMLLTLAHGTAPDSVLTWNTNIKPC